MATDFNKLNNDAFDSGMAAFERGDPRSSNPHKGDSATEQSMYWKEGYDNAKELARED